MTGNDDSDSLATLLAGTLAELSAGRGALGVAPAELFSPPRSGSLSVRHGPGYLESPIGVALGRDAGWLPTVAGAWLRGARLIQLPEQTDAETSRDGLLDAWIAVAAMRAAMGLRTNSAGQLFHVVAEQVVGGEQLTSPASPRLLTAEPAALHERWQHARSMMPLPAGAPPEPIPCTIALRAAPGAHQDALEQAGLQVLEQPAAHLVLRLDATALNPQDLGALLRTLTGRGNDELPIAELTAGLRYETVVAVLRSWGEAARQQGTSVAVQIESPASGCATPAALALRELLAKLPPSRAHRPAAWLAHLLTERLRARVACGLKLHDPRLDLRPPLLGGLAPVVVSSSALERGLQPALGDLAATVADHGAADLDDLATRHALAADDGKPLRRRVREHAEANAGVCLRDREWDAAWEAFTGEPRDRPVSARLERVLERLEHPSAAAQAVGAEVAGAARRVALARHAGSPD